MVIKYETFMFSCPKSYKKFISTLKNNFSSFPKENLHVIWLTKIPIWVVIKFFLKKIKFLLPTLEWHQVKNTEKSNNWILSKAETFQFCTKKRQKVGSLGRIKVVFTKILAAYEWMPSNQNFRKNKWPDLVKFSHFCILGTKISLLPCFQQNMISPWESKLHLLTTFANAFPQVQFHKNLMKRFRAKFTSVI